MAESTPKRMRDRTPTDLRIIAHGQSAAGRTERALEAEGELRRRIANLRGAVIPAWEIEARGANLDEWVVA